jgi:putative flippase GtrA
LVSEVVSHQRAPEAGASFANRLLSRKAAGMLARNTIVSCFCFAFDLVLLWSMVRFLHIGKLPAAAFGFVAANSVHYALGRSWIFRGTQRAVASGYFYFLANGLVGLAITVSLYAASLRYTPDHYIVARVVVSVFAGLAVFVLNAMFNFRRL